MRVADLAQGALAGLAQNRLRSSLTALGVIIGVGAVVAMMSLTTGLERFVAQQFARLGSNTLVIMSRPHMHMHGGAEWAKYKDRKDLKLEDAEAIRERNEAAESVGEELYQRPVTIRSQYSTGDTKVAVIGGGPSWIPSNGYDLAQGRNMSQIDVEHRRAVAVIGSDVARELFPNADPLLHEVVLGHKPFQVVGILASRGSFFGFGSRDDRVLIPITAFLDIWGKERSINITVQARSTELFPLARDRTIQILRQQRGLRGEKENDFEVYSNESSLERMEGVAGSITAAAIAIAMISLIVGGIGIMNIMLVSVTERTREIGVRRALGARRRTILGQFTAEAIVLSALGGIIGLLLGWSVSLLADTLFGLPAATPLWSAAVALSVAGATGLVFGIYPAWRAAHLDPIEALRYE